PLWQVIRFAAPALMAGNVGLLKHASNVPQTALFLEDLFGRAGYPDGAFQTLLIGSDKVEALLTDDRVRAATLTGSEPAGRSVGDPMAGGTDVGPLATSAGRDGVAAQVDDAAARGGRILCGGTVPDSAGWFYPPTVVADLDPSMRMWSEEVFGPVAGLYRMNSYAEAVSLANATSFGLGANAWTTDPDEQERFATDLDSGQVFINGMVTSY